MPAMRWTIDVDGDLTLSFLGVIHVTFYKWEDSPLVRWGRMDTIPATKTVWRSVQAAGAAEREVRSR